MLKLVFLNRRSWYLLIAIIGLFCVSCNQIHQPQCPLPHGEWELISEFSDEFDGTELDTSKWHPVNPGWLGRKPSFFSKDNVVVKDSLLTLVGKTETLPDLPEGYHTFTSAAVQSKGRVKYGYFEIRCKPMDSRISSAFWFYAIEPDIWTEIDVFEICGLHPDKEWEQKYFMNVHVFKTPEEGSNHWSDSETWISPHRLADKFIIVGFEWDEKELKWYVDGELLRTRENTHWHQPLTMNFDSETMHEW